MYQVPVAGALGAASGMAAATLPTGSSPVLDGAHQALAFTGFAFGAYVALAVILIVAGLGLRLLSGYSRSSR